METNLINDATIFIRHLLTAEMCKIVITKILPQLADVFKTDNLHINLEELIAKLLNLESGDFDDSELLEMSDFTTLVQYLISERTEKLSKLLLHLISLPQLQKIAFLTNLTVAMQDAFISEMILQSSTEFKGIYLEDSHQTIKLKTNFTTDDDRLSYFVTITQFPTLQDNQQRLRELKKYEGFCCLQCFTKNITAEMLQNLIYKSSKKISTSEIDQFCRNYSTNSSMGALITISMNFDISLQTWMKSNTAKRRIMDPSTVLTQVEIFARIVEHLKRFLQNELNSINFTPKDFLMLDLNEEWYFGITDELITGKWNDGTDFNSIFRRDSPSVRYSLGILMLFAISACEVEEFPELFKTFMKNGSKTSLSVLHQLSPILYCSKSCLNLVLNVLECCPSPSTNPDLCKTDFDWESLFRDFKHNVDNSTEINVEDALDGTAKKMDVPSVSEAFMTELAEELGNIYLDENDLTKFWTILTKEIREPLNVGHPIRNVQQILEYFRNQKPWRISDLFLHLYDFIPDQLTSKINTIVAREWENQLTELNYIGENSFGYLCQKLQNPELQFGSRVVLLIPKLRNDEEFATLKLRPFSRMKLELNDHDYFFNFMVKRIFHSDQLRSRIIIQDRHPLIPPQLHEILNSGVCLETWAISQETRGPTLADYIQRIKNCSKDCIFPAEPNPKYTLEVVKGLINEFQRSQRFGDLCSNCCPEAYSFRKTYHDGNSTFYKLPLGHDNIHLITPTKNGTEMSKYTLNSSEETLSTNIYSLGVMLIQLLAPEEFDFVNHPNQDWNSYLNNLQLPEIFTIDHPQLLPAIRSMINPDENCRMSVKELQSLEIESLNLKNIQYSRDVDIKEFNKPLQLVEENMVGVDVMQILWEELKSLFLEVKERYSGTGKQNGLKDSMQLLQKLNQSEISEDDDDIDFEEISKILIGFKQGELSYLENNNNRLFTGLLYDVYYEGDQDLRDKLLTTIKKVWFQRFENITLVGSGDFGFVVKAKDRMNKEWEESALKFVFPRTQKEESYASEEIRNLDSMNHPNIVGMSSFIRNFPFEEADLRTILQFDADIPDDTSPSELSSMGDSLPKIIATLIIASKESPLNGCLMKLSLGGSTLKQWLVTTLPERSALSIAMGQTQLRIIRDLMRGMKYLQFKGILHSDIKPDNIIFSLDESSSVQIIDLGLSRLFHKNRGSSKFRELELKSVRGNTRYQAPEIWMNYDESCDTEYSLNSEIYSIALIFMEVMIPMSHTNRALLAQNVAKFKKNATTWIKTYLKGDAADDIKFVQDLCKMLDVDPVKRLSCNEFQALDYDWIFLHAMKPCSIQSKIGEILKM